MKPRSSVPASVGVTDHFAMWEPALTVCWTLETDAPTESGPRVRVTLATTTAS